MLIWATFSKVPESKVKVLIAVAPPMLKPLMFSVEPLSVIVALDVPAPPPLTMFPLNVTVPPVRFIVALAVPPTAEEVAMVTAVPLPLPMVVVPPPMLNVAVSVF